MPTDRPEGYDEAERTARDYARDRERTGYLVDEAFQKLERNKGVLAKVLTDLQSMMRLVRAWYTGEYTQAPWRTVVGAIAAVVYFVNPFDVVPDFIPGAGFVDDAVVIVFVLKAIKHDVEKFLQWDADRKARS